VLQREWRSLVSLLWLPGIALFLAVTAPWFVLMQQRFPEFSHYFFVVQHFTRFAAGGFNNQQPIYFYPVVLILLALPWSAWMLAGARPGAWRGGERWALRQLAWIWMLVMIAFFSMPESKLVGYILPAAPPLALLAADSFESFGNRWPGAARWWKGSAVFAVIVCTAVVVVTASFPRHSARELGLVMRQRIAPGDRVIFLHSYYFDLPFYAKLQSPTGVVDAWDSPGIKARDNWRKELADAARFDPALGHELLLLPKDLPATWCGGVVWVVGTSGLREHYPMLKEAEVVAQQRDLVLWRLPGRAGRVSQPSCDGTPSESSAGKS
jgi:hypothetical protein